MSGARLAFIAPMVLVAYTYVGYPLLLWIATRLRPRDPRKAAALPSVSIIIAARNEADKIRRKIEHSLALDYPSERLEIIVASDASDDGTDDIVREYAGRGVRLVRAPQRKGKEHAQGLALAAARGDVIVMTDAATLLETGALRSLVAEFRRPLDRRGQQRRPPGRCCRQPHRRGRVREVRDVGAPAREPVSLAGRPEWIVLRDSPGAVLPLAGPSCQRFHVRPARGAGRLSSGRRPVSPGPVRGGDVHPGGDAAEGADVPAGHHGAHGQPRPPAAAPVWPLRLSAGQPQATAVRRSAPAAGGADRERPGLLPARTPCSRRSSWGRRCFYLGSLAGGRLRFLQRYASFGLLTSSPSCSGRC